jgi:hypothetical protein
MKAGRNNGLSRSTPWKNVHAANIRNKGREPNLVSEIAAVGELLRPHGEILERVERHPDDQHHREKQTTADDGVEIDAGGNRRTLRRGQTDLDHGRIRLLEHDPEKAWPGLDPGWAPVFGKDHAPPISWSGMTGPANVIPL